jgi:hypothetical protein
VFARNNKENESPRTYLRRVAKTENADFTYMRQRAFSWRLGSRAA